jgi:hypothetical protein
MKSKELTLDGLKRCVKPMPWKALSRVACDNQSGISIKEPVVVSGRELTRLEAKIQAVRDDLHAAHLKVRALLKKSGGKTVNNMKKKQQARIVGRAKNSSKSDSPFVTPNAWLELSKTEKECARALYVLIPQASLRKRCLGIMDVLEKIGDGYLMQLLKMKVLASAKFSPSTILYKVRLNFPPTGIFTADLFLDGHLQQRVQLQCARRAPCMSGWPAQGPTRVAPFQIPRAADRGQGGKGSSQIHGAGAR